MASGFSRTKRTQVASGSSRTKRTQVASGFSRTKRTQVASGFSRTKKRRSIFAGPALLLTAVILAHGTPATPSNAAAAERRQAVAGRGPAQAPAPAAGRGRGRVFDREAIARARTIFEPTCGFCHGNDARGRAAGPDLARSLVVLNDTAGKELGEYLRTGAPERGMPAFAGLTARQVADIAEFLHERVEAARNRNPIDPMASVVGDPLAGAAYFSGAGRCSTCHSVTGDLAGIGAKYDPMTLQDRIVSPRPQGPGGRSAAPPGPSRSAKTVTVTLPSGENASGTLLFISEFAVTLIDQTGQRRSFTRAGGVPKVVVTDPLQAHLNLLRQYTDRDMHNVTAYLVTIK